MGISPGKTFASKLFYGNRNEPGLGFTFPSPGLNVGDTYTVFLLTEPFVTATHTLYRGTLTFFGGKHQGTPKHTHWGWGFSPHLLGDNIVPQPGATKTFAFAL